MKHSILKQVIQTENDVVFARQRTKQISELIGFNLQDQTRLATAVSEITRNAYSYAKRGEIEFILDLDANPQVLLIQINDKGHGISNLSDVLEGKIKSKKGMGIGISGSKKLVNIFEITSDPKNGTRVLIGKYLPEKLTVNSESYSNLIRNLHKSIPRNILDELRNQNNELLKALEIVNNQKEELTKINNELSETNRGVVALHSELVEEVKIKEEHLNIIALQNEKLENAHKQKNLFISRLSHELRVPLNAIIGFADLLEDQVPGELNDKQLEYVQLITKNGIQLSELIGDLLDISRIDSGKMLLNSEPCYSECLIDEVISSLEHKRQEKKIDIQHNYTQSSKKILIDRKRFKQIIFNLLSNALKFTPENGNIIIAQRFLNEQYLEVSVQDNGIGIDEKDLLHLFNDFYQVDSIKGQSLSGLGIGLSLTKRLVELFEGKISVKSYLNKGSLFTFTIPIRDAADLPEANVNLSEFNNISMPRGKKILIVEDNQMNLYLLKELLSRFEHQLTFANNGLEALEAVKKELPDIILMDIKMPVMDGMEAIKILRQMPDLDKLPIIALTAITGSEAIKEQLEAGFTRHISKPISSKEIYRIISELLP